MELVLKLGSGLLRKASQAEGSAGAKAGRHSSAGSFRVDPGGDEARVQC